MIKISIVDIYSINDHGKTMGHYIPVANLYKSIFSSCSNFKIVGGPIYRKYIEANYLNILPFGHKEGGNFLINKLKLLANCFKAFNNSSDIFIVQHASLSILFLWLALFKAKGKKLYLITYYNELIGINKILFKFAKKKITGILCPYKEVGERYNLPYLVVPDYIYIPDNNNENFVSYEERIYDIGVFGLISYQKGTLEVLQKLANTKFKVLITGKCPDPILFSKINAIIDSCNNITSNFGFLSFEEYKRNIQYSRFCILNYSTSYMQRSSGVVFDALFNNTPVIGHKSDALDFILKQNLGFIYTDLNSCNFSSIITPENFYRYISNIHKFQETNSKAISVLKSFILK